ncbi:MAG: polyprenol monophosphomannose synthase [Kofleriaceae bacterium]|nr:polyprenol monophosphomannose synthase [Kofleriaceae bacterium]MCL4226223.1 polyprenol monophosphomannose synthase [Myxococcales bacterium]
MAPPRVLIIVPTYNERENVEEVARHFLTPVPDASILFVDDNSPDGTGPILDRLAAADPRLHVLHRPGKQGLGKAYLAGFAWGLARPYDLFIEMDADFSHDPTYLPRLIELAAEADVVVGSRNVAGGGTRNWGLGRKLISRGGSFYARTVLGVKVRDMTAGFVCWRRSALEAISLDDVESNGYGFQIEMKYRALRAGLRVVETPIIFVDRRVGQSKMSRGIVAEAMRMVWRLRAKG